MRYCQKRYFVFTLIVGSIIFMFGCSQKISKTAFTNHMYGADYSQLHEHFETCKKWDNCFDFSKAEFKTNINQIYDTCIKQETKNLPQMIGYSDRVSFGTSLDLCATDMFFKRYKENFTFDKTPECIEQCKKIKKLIKKLR